MKSNSDPLARTPSFSLRSATRREFLRTSGAAAVGGLFAGNLSLPIRGAAAAGGDVLRVGLVGCGGRGTGAANQALDRKSVV